MVYWAWLLGVSAAFALLERVRPARASQPPLRSQLANDLGLATAPVVAHHSDSIMSNGEVIEPYHYATFLEVLGTMTGTTGEWTAGPGNGPSLGPGDFNAPTGSTTVA